MPNIIDLSDFAEGAVAERINEELKRVLQNIADPNTDPKKARKLQLTITMKADEKRDVANVSVVAKTTLAPARDIETKIIMGIDNDGSVVGAELKSGVKGQMYMDQDGDVADDTGNKVAPEEKESKVINYQRRSN